MNAEQQQAQFNWLQDRLADPNFAGIALGSGDIISLATLRCIKSAEELSRLLQPEAFPLKPVEKT